MTGFGPTAVGYLVQGGAKFAGYESVPRYNEHLLGLIILLIGFGKKN
jgi:solute carrier family 25 phosphate transporter 3